MTEGNSKSIQMLSGDLSRFDQLPLLSFFNKRIDIDCNALEVLKASMYKILGAHVKL